METQLVRLDAPYNLIFTRSGAFALHIATLIVVDEEKTEMSVKRTVQLHPVVNMRGMPEGMVWSTVNLLDCKVACRQGELINIYDLKRIMQEIIPQYHVWAPTSLQLELEDCGSRFILPEGSDSITQREYTVYLTFSEITNQNTDDEGSIITERSIRACSSNDSSFWFCVSRQNEQSLGTGLLMVASGYASALKKYGFKKFIFITKDPKYKEFVDKLNSMPLNTTK